MGSKPSILRAKWLSALEANYTALHKLNRLGRLLDNEMCPIKHPLMLPVAMTCTLDKGEPALANHRLKMYNIDLDIYVCYYIISLHIHYYYLLVIINLIINNYIDINIIIIIIIIILNIVMDII